MRPGRDRSILDSFGEPGKKRNHEGREDGERGRRKGVGSLFFLFLSCIGNRLGKMVRKETPDPFSVWNVG
jgi:hypothetical protein